MFNKKKNNLTIYLYINIVYIFLGTIINYLVKGITYKDYCYGFIPFFIINLMYILYLIIKKKYIFHIADILAIFCTICCCVSCINAINSSVTILGNSIRHEGLLSVIYYYSLLVISSYIDKKDRIKVIKLIIISGIVHSLIAILQSYKIISVFGKYGCLGDSCQSTTTNGNYLAAYLLMCIIYNMTLLLREENKSKINLLLALFILLTGLYLTNTLASFLSLIVILVIFLIYLIRRRDLKKILYLIGPFIIIGITLSYMGKTKLFNDTKIATNQFQEMTNGTINDKFGTNRVYIWRNTIKIVPKYIDFGCGIGNYIYAFDGHALRDEKRIYDLSHNEFLNLLVTEGIFSLMAYIILIFILIKKDLLKLLKDNTINIYTLVVLGYLMQSFFSNRVMEVAPIFYISLGFIKEYKE